MLLRYLITDVRSLFLSVALISISYSRKLKLLLFTLNVKMIICTQILINTPDGCILVKC